MYTTPGCNGYGNWWWADYNSSQHAALWLRDDKGNVCYSDTDHPPMPGGHSPGRGPLYDLCNPAMMEYYKGVILSSTVDSPDIAGAFFDEVSHASLLRYSEAFFGCKLSGAQQRRTEQCWLEAMVNLTEWMAFEHGKYAIMSTQAYVNGSGGGERPPWHAAQSAMLARTGSFYYPESLCPDFPPIPPRGHRHWMCQSFDTREQCCIAQLFTVLEFSGQAVPVPTMIRAQVEEPGDYFDFLTGAFLAVAGQWSYVAMGKGWSGPTTSFPWFEAYDQPLGRPLGPTEVVSRAQGVFRREFEHLRVEVNVSAW